MSKAFFRKFKKMWSESYAKQFSEATNEEKREIKNNVYKNINMTDDEKDEIWQRIMFLSEGRNKDETKENDN